MLTAEAMKKTTIGNTDDCQLTTLVNSASMAPPIGLLQKGIKFCHTSKILLVGCQCRRATSRLYFNSYALVGRLVGQSVGQMVRRSVGWLVS
jgi:hypothetical protein